MSDRITLRYRVVADRRRPEDVVGRWLVLAGALAQWPGAPVVVERRLVTPGPDALVAELLVLTAHGRGVVASGAELERDLSHLLRPLVAGATCQRLGRARARAGFDVAARDVAEYRPTDGGALDAAAPAASLRAALGVLAEECGRATVSFAIGTPPAILDEDPVRRPVRFGVRVAADAAIPNAVLAHLGAILSSPGAWELRRRVPGDAERAALRCAATLPESSGVVEAELAAAFASLPVGRAALARRQPVCLPWRDRAGGVAVVGHGRERRRFLARAVDEDLRHGRPVTVVTIGERASGWSSGEGDRAPRVLVTPAGGDGTSTVMRAIRDVDPAGAVVVDRCDRLPAPAVRRALHDAARQRVALTLGAPTAVRGVRTVVALPGGEGSLPSTYRGGPLADGAAVVYHVGDPGSLRHVPDSAGTKLRLPA